MEQDKRERDIETRLRRYAAVCVRLLADRGEPEKKEEAIKALLQIASMPRTRGTRWDFVLEQIGYLGRYCLADIVGSAFLVSYAPWHPGSGLWRV